MRRKVVAGNWKMNNTIGASKKLTQKIVEGLKERNLSNTEVIIAPPFVNIEVCHAISEGSLLEVAAQNMHQAESGAFTGEISGPMLTSIGLEYVILGHSERREYFGETDELLAEKVNAALANELTTIFCFGEVLEERKANDHFNVVKNQIENALFHLGEADWRNIILAYEPVWAIGTGETASPEQAQEMHEYIRSVVADKYGSDVADDVPILYGGSVKPGNAKEIFSKPDVDGGLIGGASLQSEDFLAIVDSI